MKQIQSNPFGLDINKEWTLFLDRDGVLNHEKNDDYIRNVSEFIFYDGVLESLKKLSSIFGWIFVVTNQRGIGKGLMTDEDLNEIHQFMLNKIKETGGRIDQIYYAPDLETDAMNRKPNIGMGLQAKKDYPSIVFSKSIMVGNNISDMKFGKALSMKTIFLETTSSLTEEKELVDIKLDNIKMLSALFRD